MRREGVHKDVRRVCLCVCVCVCAGVQSEGTQWTGKKKPVKLHNNEIKDTQTGIGYIHLEVCDESLHGDFLFDQQEEAGAAQDHALQDG